MRRFIKTLLFLFSLMFFSTTYAQTAKDLFEQGNTYEETDKDKAVKYWKLAADKNYAPAYHALANYYFSDMEGENSKNNKLALSYWEKAAKLGHAESQYQLGFWYFVKENYSKAESLFKQALKNGYDDKEEIESLLKQIQQAKQEQKKTATKKKNTSKTKRSKKTSKK